MDVIAQKVVENLGKYCVEGSNIELKFEINTDSQIPPDKIDVGEYQLGHWDKKYKHEDSNSTMIPTTMILKTTEELKVREWKLLCSSFSIMLQPHREFELFYDIIVANEEVIVICDVPGIGELSWEEKIERDDDKLEEEESLRKGKEDKGKEKESVKEGSSGAVPQLAHSRKLPRGNCVSVQVKPCQVAELSQLVITRDSLELEIIIYRKLWRSTEKGDTITPYPAPDHTSYDNVRAGSDGKKFNIPLPRNCKQKVKAWHFREGVMTVIIPLFKLKVDVPPSFLQKKQTENKEN